VLGIMDPLRDNAFAAAAGDAKSIKQYPALLSDISRGTKDLVHVDRLTLRTYLGSS